MIYVFVCKLYMRYNYLYHLQHDSEFAREYLTQRPNRTKSYQMKMEFSNLSVEKSPTSIDWRKKGVVTSVKYQVCNTSP